MSRLAALASVLLALAGPAAAQDLAIVHARAWTLTRDTPVEDATVLVRDGRIVAVGPGLAPPPGARVIDAKGHVVTPGLFNASTQLGLVEVSGVDATSDVALKASPLGAAFDVSYAVNPNAEAIAVARADGVTRAMAVPDASGQAPFAGQGALLHLVEGADIVERPRAALYVDVGGTTLAAAGGSRAAQWQLLRNALDEARAYHARKSSLAPRDQLLNHLDAMALEPVLAGHEPLVISADRESDIRQAVRLAADEHVRVVIQGGAEAWRCAALLAAARVPVVLDPFADLPDTFDQIGARLDNAAILHRAGVGIAFALVDGFSTIFRTDAAGEALREAAGLSVANGLPWIEALRAITAAPAHIFGVAHAGALAVGEDADLVVWTGDPLDVAAWPTHVVVQGREASLATRQTDLAARYAPPGLKAPQP